ncbi:glycosyltransferase [Limnobacter sp.]|uniref:glycosyltransferase n=1 Tax=Limnobacter sp. TaxID=2003368 RepID=UPI0035193841
MGANSKVKAPFFSVIMPIHRWHELLPLAIQSILKQTDSDFEFLIAANGPASLELEEQLTPFVKNDARVRIVSTPMPGLVFALNLLIQQARGAYLVRMDGDDLSEPNRLETMRHFLLQYPETDVLGSNYLMIDSHGDIIKISSLPEFNSTIRRLLPFNCVLAHPTVAMRTSLVLSLQGYMYGHASEDYDLWLRMLRRRPKVVFHNLREAVFRYRVHAGQSTGADRIGLFVAHDIGLRLREFLLTANPMFIVGIFRSLVQLVVRKVQAWTGKRA